MMLRAMPARDSIAESPQWLSTHATPRVGALLESPPSSDSGS
jgi:hypothetical protein